MYLLNHQFQCDVDGCAEMYAPHAVIVNKLMDKSAHGIEGTFSFGLKQVKFIF